jgi:hypothetical protein
MKFQSGGDFIRAKLILFFSPADTGLKRPSTVQPLDPPDIFSDPLYTIVDLS